MSPDYNFTTPNKYPPIHIMSKIGASASLEFDNLPKLLGQSNYIPWANAWKVAFRANRWWNIVSDELEELTGEGKEGTPGNIRTSKSEITVEDCHGPSGRMQRNKNTRLHTHRRRHPASFSVMAEIMPFTHHRHNHGETLRFKERVTGQEEGKIGRAHV